MAREPTVPIEMPARLDLWIAELRGRLIGYHHADPFADAYYQELAGCLLYSANAAYDPRARVLSWNRLPVVLADVWPPSADYPPIPSRAPSAPSSGSRFATPADSDQVSVRPASDVTVPLTRSSRALEEESEGEGGAEPSSPARDLTPPPTRTLRGEKRQAKGKTPTPKPTKTPRLSIRLPPAAPAPAVPLPSAKAGAPAPSRRPARKAKSADPEADTTEKANRDRRGPPFYLAVPPCPPCLEKKTPCLGDGTRRHTCEPCARRRTRCVLRNDPPPDRK